MPTGVTVRDNESFEQALRRFKRKCEKSGILTEIKKRQHYEKPSVKRKRKALAARKKLRPIRPKPLMATFISSHLPEGLIQL